MDFIDDRGRLFGAVNVVDALVVLFVLAVVVAGAAVAFGGGGTGPPDDDSAHRIVTVDLGTHPEYVAQLLEPGNVTVAGVDASITDVYRTPSGDGVRLVAKATVPGETTPAGFRLDGTLVRYGTRVALATPEYRIGGNVLAVDQTETFDTRQVDATVRANVSTAVADAIETGDAQRIAGESVATVEGVERVDSDGERVILRVDLSLVTLPRDDSYRYGGAPVRIGRELAFQTTRYEFEGEVVAVDP